MKKLSKTDDRRYRELLPISMRYSKNAWRAKEWFAKTGTPMFQPGALAEMMKASKAASAEIQTILAQYR